MKKNIMSKGNEPFVTEEGYKLKFRERDSTEVRLSLGNDTLEFLEETAAKKDISVESLIKFFISKGLRDIEPELSARRAVERFKNRKSGNNQSPDVDLAA